MLRAVVSGAKIYKQEVVETVPSVDNYSFINFCFGIAASSEEQLLKLLCQQVGMAT